MPNIRTAGRSGFIRREGGRRRDTVWVAEKWTENNLASGAAILLDVFSVATLALRPFTIVRTRGMLLVNSDQTVATERQLGAFGMAIVSDQAVAIGITAIPTPITDRDSDLWFLYEPFARMQNVADATGVSAYSPQVFDSKAMRKVEDGQEMVGVAELDTLSDGATFQQTFRMLLKLH